MLGAFLLSFLIAPLVHAHDDLAGRGYVGNDAPCTPIGPFGLPGLGDPPSQIGSWAPVQIWPARATHSVLLHTGKVLWWRNGLNAPTQLFDPTTGVNSAKPPPEGISDMLCTGHVPMADGRILVMGGAGGNPFDASALTLIFDPATESWTRVADMKERRWYPTARALPDGRVMAFSGTQGTNRYVKTPEIYDPDSDTWTLIHTASMKVPNYPFIFVLPSGRVLYAGNAPAKGDANLVRPTWSLDLHSQLWSYEAPSLLASNRGSAVMYSPFKILKAGGRNPASNLTERLDLLQPTPTWEPAASMVFPRRRANMLMLPDGKVLAIGGTTGGQDAPACAVLASELWDPAADTWTQMASMARPRMYHSTALLLPDGRVLAAGGDNSARTNGEESGEVYSPPYLFQGPRPTITAGPASGVYGEEIQIATPDAASIASAVLIRPASVTHNFDQSQTFVPVYFTNEGSHLRLILPLNGSTAPPGPYMLFLVNGAGVPSVAHWIFLDEPACSPTPDSDSDGHPDCDDNCPNIANGAAEASLPGVGDQTDSDGDLAGDACDPDDDNDTLADWVETNTGVYVSPSDTGTDPRNFFSDADELSDAAEVMIFGTSPVQRDTDGDGLDDDDEVNVHGTDPNRADTDGDTLDDRQEVLLGSNPLDLDSDDDGLGDGTEVDVYHTDPNETDTDGDGFADGVEVTVGSFANNPDSTPLMPALPPWGIPLLAGVLLISRRRRLRS